MINLKNDDRILFEGDSITDAFRDRADFHSLSGYSKIICEHINLHRPASGVECFNRGISGDTSTLLLNRIEGDLAEIKPTVISILIGINDSWRRYTANQIKTPEEYGMNISRILDIAAKFTDRIIIIEPFLIKVGFKTRKLRQDLDEKISVLKGIAIQRNIEYIPMDSIFKDACVKTKARLYSYDGVHLTDYGYEFLSKECLKHISF